MEMLSLMLLESRRETVRMLKDYPSSYDAHYKVFIEIEKQNPEGAARAMVDHFRMMERRALEARMAARPADQG